MRPSLCDSPLNPAPDIKPKQDTGPSQLEPPCKLRMLGRAGVVEIGWIYPRPGIRGEPGWRGALPSPFIHTHTEPYPKLGHFNMPTGGPKFMLGRHAMLLNSEALSTQPFQPHIYLPTYQTCYLTLSRYSISCFQIFIKPPYQPIHLSCPIHLMGSCFCLIGPS